MRCSHPLIAYVHNFRKNVNGGKLVTFHVPKEGIREWSEIRLPCGKCIDCRLEQSKNWAVRCVNEAQLHESNCFVTLTYDNDHLPSDGSLRPDDMTLFLKRLRKVCDEKYDCKVRFLYCGEYGEKFARPHYHLLLFGFNFPDKVLYRARRGFLLWNSPTLKKLWPFGFGVIADFSFESAAYVSRYCTKKITGDVADSHYNGKLPEFIRMSRRPGIGFDWIINNVNIYNYDELVIRGGKKMRPPRYYDKVVKEFYPEFFDYVAKKREIKAIKLQEDYINKPADERFNIEKTHDELMLLRFSRLVRAYERGVDL